jgi:uncharacterized membrane protein YqaE (UPF0057 family)
VKAQQPQTYRDPEPSFNGRGLSWASKKAITGVVVMDLIRIIFAILLPPLGVFLQVGLGLHFWLNILLTICGYIPGIIHAVWIIARR